MRLSTLIPTLLLSSTALATPAGLSGTLDKAGNALAQGGSQTQEQSSAQTDQSSSSNDNAAAANPKNQANSSPPANTDASPQPDPNTGSTGTGGVLGALGQDSSPQGGSQQAAPGGQASSGQNGAPSPQEGSQPTQRSSGGNLVDGLMGGNGGGSSPSKTGMLPLSRSSKTKQGCWNSPDCMFQR